MNVTSTHDHDWAVHQLAAYGTGLLAEEQTLRLEDHLRDCGDCRARLDSMRHVSPPDAGHLPASLIATWPRATRLLSGIERHLVEAHLRSCADCRGALAFAGHEPGLASEPLRVPARPAQLPVRRRSWGWALALSGAAAAAAWLLMVRPALSPRDAGTSATMAPLPARSSAGAFELALPRSTPGAIALPEAASGSAPPLVVAPLAADGGLNLHVPQWLRPHAANDGARRVSLEARRAGREFAHRVCSLGELGEVIGLGTGSRLSTGDYEFRISVDAARPGEAARVASWVLRVR
jgi:hypothetical protein